MFPNKSDKEIAEIAAEFFNAISQEFDPVRPPQPNCTKPAPEMYEIAAALRACKKPKSQVKGDIDRRLVSKYSDILAIPLHVIYTQVYQTLQWPELWASETVTLIPKNKSPDGLKQLRNLSCTPLFSKVLESFILKALKEKVRLSNNQFGGIKGSGVDHFLVETWDEILQPLEDHRAAVQLMSIDFEKAFNRMCHNSCLLALDRLGAEKEDIELVGCFLRNRTMRVRVGKCFSDPRKVPGGSPQGSILGNFLFCATTNEFNLIESGHRDANEPQVMGLGEVRGGEDDGEDEEESYGSEYEDSHDFRFFRKNRDRIIEDTQVSARYTQEEIDNYVGVPAGWKQTKSATKAYIDDLNIVEKVRHIDSISVISQNKQKTLVHAPQSEHIFKEIASRAAQLNMKVNEEKTQVLCIPAAASSQVESYINANTKRISSGNSLKILGFWFGSTPGVELHVASLEEKFRSRLWSLRHLKRSGMSVSDMETIYLTVIRPVLDFASVGYHSLLTKDQEERLEKLQRRALKVIHGVGSSYSDILENNSMEKLSERRERMFVKFAVKSSKNPRISSKWFPERPPCQHDIRNQNKFIEYHARTDRLQKSPLFQLRKRLNELHRHD